MSQSIPVTAEALLIRRWALSLLGTESGPDEAAWDAALAVGVRGWDLFLRVERCALPIQLRLQQLGMGNRIRGAVSHNMKVRATREFQRVLSARAHLLELDRISTGREWAPIILKGGLTAANGGQLDLVDIDLLPAAGIAREVAETLEGEGFRAMGIDRSTSEHHHLVARMQPDSLPIEVHRAVEGFTDPELDYARSRAIPIPGHDNLLRFSTTDQLRHLLMHITLQHPERAGRIRDLLVIADLLGRSSSTEIAESRAELSSHEQAEIFQQILNQSEALHQKEWGRDPFEVEALSNYIATERAGRGRRSEFRHYLHRRSLFLAVSTRSLATEFRIYQGRATTPIESHAIGYWLRRRLPVVADLFHYLTRLPLFFITAALALQLSREARRLLALVTERE